jgi:hypothetical protein
MTNSITKVTNLSSTKIKKDEKNLTGWHAVLRDIENDIQTLMGHRAIVRRKIEKGEPWPGSDGYTVTQKAGTDSASIPA